jgi:hypothetical protein
MALNPESEKPTAENAVGVTVVKLITLPGSIVLRAFVAAIPAALANSVPLSTKRIGNKGFGAPERTKLIPAPKALHCSPPVQ